MLNVPSAPEAPDPAEVAPPKRGGLGQLAIKGSIYEIASFGATQTIRLLANLLLTRLLTPEAFGLSAMINIVNFGLTMLSDLGISPSVVQSPRGDEKDFLDTAWTMHVVRGVGLFCVSVLLSWPVAWLYDEPLLGPLLAVGSINILLSGFESTSVITLLRRVDSKRLATLDLAVQLASLAVTIGGAYYTRSVWALVAGGLAGGVIRTLVSHFFLDVGYRNQFHWSKENAKQIVRFGRWVFLASAVGFFAGQIDRLFLGKFLGLTELGIYSVAVALAELGAAIVQRLTHQILFPIFSRIHREEPQRLGAIFYRARLALDALALPAAGVLFVLAPWIIDFLYDDRYVGAAWILSILTLRVTLSCIAVPMETCLFAMGHSHFGFTKSVCKMAAMVVGLPLGYHYYGLQGIVWATALSELPALFVLVPAFARRKLLLLRRELLVPLFFAIGVGLGHCVVSLLG